MYLGVEIGGTKLQVGVGSGDGSTLVALERSTVDAARGATGILRQVETIALPLIRKHKVRRIGIGFGGPIDGNTGAVVKSHHVTGWSDFPIVQWCRQTLGLPAVLANDADTAGLAE